MTKRSIEAQPARSITLFVCGDVMTGRGIDQVLSHPGDPTLYEPYVKDARDYVHLAERTNGPIPSPVQPSYIWGDALDELEKASPDLRIVNLETSITNSDDYWRGKAINFRVNRASTNDALWLRNILNREGSVLGTHVDLDRENVLTLRWD
jgi:poly-gamma-glutamate synthesis protein (capsule biosynthesis protein)